MICYNRDSGVACDDLERAYAGWRTFGYRISCYSSRTRIEAPDVLCRPCADLPSVEWRTLDRMCRIRNVGPNGLVRSCAVRQLVGYQTHDRMSRTQYHSTW
jgi:hypothetical protein